MKPYDPVDEHAGSGDGLIHYFLPARLILQLEHPAGIDKDGLVAAWKDFLNQTDHPWKAQLEIAGEDSIITFKVGEPDTPVFSLVPMKVSSAGAAEAEVVTLVNDIYKDLKLYKNPKDSNDKREPLRVSGAVTLKSVTPSWLMNGASHQIGLGGPGAWPEPEAPEDGSWPKFNLLGKENYNPEGTGAGVHVAILDTAPQSTDLDAALGRLGSKHPLLESLWDAGKGNRLNLHPNPADLQLVTDYSLLGHRYRMPDHGLFAAGIIRTLAPEATLHLVEVLNPFGVGCVETIARGLMDVLEDPAIGRPLLVNMSLMLSMPRKGQPSGDFPADLQDAGIQDHMILSLEDIFSFLKDRGDVIVVAAAGNDSHGAPGRPPARLPAAFQTVIGVGALPRPDPAKRHIEPASYSNLSDVTPVTGFATLGGEAGVKRGILGVYIGEFPEYCGPLPLDLKGVQPDRIQYRPNTSGWAWWAGTSFATPVITGLLASLGGGKTLTAVDATKLLDALVSDRTGVREKEIVVDQPM